MWSRDGDWAVPANHGRVCAPRLHYLMMDHQCEFYFSFLLFIWHAAVDTYRRGQESGIISRYPPSMLSGGRQPPLFYLGCFVPSAFFLSPLLTGPFMYLCVSFVSRYQGTNILRFYYNSQQLMVQLQLISAAHPYDLTHTLYDLYFY